MISSILRMIYISFFFFFKQKTAYEMRISDWSSDVCSSDLDEEDKQFKEIAFLLGKHRNKIQSIEKLKIQLAKSSAALEQLTATYQKLESEREEQPQDRKSVV